MIRARKNLGQNFLKDDLLAGRIISLVSAGPDDLIIEIGPGTGALTRGMLETAGLVIAIEIDHRLVRRLQMVVSYPNLEVIEGDALVIDYSQLIIDGLTRMYKEDGIKPYSHARIVGNLPYYISTALLQKLIEHRSHIYDMTLMLQSEVVDRIIANPGCKEYGYLSILVQYYCAAIKLLDVPPSSFIPKPKVDSAVIRLTFKRPPFPIISAEEAFFDLVRASFAHRRKTLINNLKSWRPGAGKLVEGALMETGIDGTRRAETLTIEELALLHEALNRT